MKVERLALPGVLRLVADRRTDSRGTFTVTWSADALARAGVFTRFVQDNESVSTRGVLRGMHLQRPTAQGKLVRCVVGEVCDVVVDVRPDSATFGRWLGVILSEERPDSIWIPPGFAHGFLTLSQRSVVHYKVDAAYVPAEERVLAWDDPEVDIAWPLRGLTPLLSDRDRVAEPLSSFR